MANTNAPTTQAGMLQGSGMKLLTTAQVSEMLQISTVTLEQWRCRGKGPPYHKLDKRMVRYDQAEIELYLQAHKVLPKADAP